MAAKIYGSKRPLADIDIDIENKYIDLIFNKTQKYVIFGPANYKDKEFNLLLMAIDYKGQKIDISGIYDRYLFNKSLNKWQKDSINLLDSVKKKVNNKVVPVIPLRSLLKYKKKIVREVDITDIGNLTI